MTDRQNIATAAELGELLGVSANAVRNFADQGRVVRAPMRARYVVDESVRRYCAHLRDMAAGRSEEGTAMSLAKERARLAREQAELASLKAAQLRGELVLAADIQAHWVALMKALRSRLLAVPSRVLPLSRRDAAAVIAEIREALNDLSDAKIHKMEEFHSSKSILTRANGLTLDERACRMKASHGS